MGVRLGIAAGLVLADEAVEHVVGHLRLDPRVAGRAAVIEIEVGIHDVGNEVRLAQGQPAQRIGHDVVLGLEEVLTAVEARRERVRAIEDPVAVAEDVHDIRRGRGDQDQRRARRRVDDAVIGVERDREHRAALPLEGVRLGLAVGPDLGGAAAFDHHHDLFVHVFFGIKRPGRRHLDDVAAPFALGAVELDEGAFAAHARPRLERHVLHAAHADAAEDRNTLFLHVIVVGRVRPFPGAVTRVLQPFGFVPMIAGDFVHGCRLLERSFWPAIPSQFLVAPAKLSHRLPPTTRGRGLQNRQPPSVRRTCGPSIESHHAATGSRQDCRADRRRSNSAEHGGRCRSRRPHHLCRS